MRRTDLERMTDDELQRAKLSVDQQIATLREEKHAIAQVEDQRVTRQALLAKLGNLSDGERAALAQLVKADGISSGETFGAPGA